MKIHTRLAIALNLAVALILAGCAGGLGYQGMSPEQIKATNGTSSCTQYKGLYGSASMVSINADDTRKGATSKGRTEITCGDAKMVIDAEVGVPVPAGSTTTTTTVVQPAPVAPAK
jgi:hypothetical protein